MPDHTDDTWHIAFMTPSRICRMPGIEFVVYGRINAGFLMGQRQSRVGWGFYILVGM